MYPAPVRAAGIALQGLHDQPQLLRCTSYMDYKAGEAIIGYWRKFWVQQGPAEFSASWLLSGCCQVVVIRTYQAGLRMAIRIQSWLRTRCLSSPHGSLMSQDIVLA